jgi:LysM repeat protein
VFDNRVADRYRPQRRSRPAAGRHEQVEDAVARRVEQQTGSESNVRDLPDGPPDETGPGLQQTTVQSGDTLWSIAQRIAPDNDPRDVIAQIRRINHLQSSSLRVGQQLLLPVPSR